MESGKEIEVKVLNNKGNIVSEHVFIQDGIFTVAGSFIYHYQGNLKFPERGTWTLLIDGEKQSRSKIEPKQNRSFRRSGRSDFHRGDPMTLVLGCPLQLPWLVIGDWSQSKWGQVIGLPAI